MPPSAQQPVTTSSSDPPLGAGPLGELLFATFEAPGSTPNTEQSYATTLPATPPVPYRGTENREAWELPMEIPWQHQLPDPPSLGNPATDRELEAFLAARTAIVEEMVSRVTSNNDTPINSRGQPSETIHEVYQQNPMLEGFRHASQMWASWEQRRATSLGGLVTQHPWAH